MRLQNIVKQGKTQFRMVMDSEKADCNYIEKCYGGYWFEDDYRNLCIKCLEPIQWNDWTSETTARNTCACGQEHKLSIIEFDYEANSLPIE